MITKQAFSRRPASLNWFPIYRFIKDLTLRLTARVADEVRALNPTEIFKLKAKKVRNTLKQLSRLTPVLTRFTEGNSFSWQRQTFTSPLSTQSYSKEDHYSEWNRIVLNCPCGHSQSSLWWYWIVLYRHSTGLKCTSSKSKYHQQVVLKFLLYFQS